MSLLVFKSGETTAGGLRGLLPCGDLRGRPASSLDEARGSPLYDPPRKTNEETAVPSERPPCWRQKLKTHTHTHAHTHTHTHTPTHRHTHTHTHTHTHHAHAHAHAQAGAPHPTMHELESEGSLLNGAPHFIGPCLFYQKGWASIPPASCIHPPARSAAYCLP